MKRTILQKSFIRMATCIGALSIAVTGFSLSLLEGPMSLERMTREADEIVWGTVVSQETRIVGGSFETDYQVQVHENVKSGGGARGVLAQGRSFTLTVPGGALEEPPLTQYAMGAPYLYAGEEVFLFLSNPAGRQSEGNESARAAGVRSKLGVSYQVVGWNQGRFSVITREDNGEKIVTRMNLDALGMAAGSTEMREAAKALATRQVATVNQQIVRTKDIAAQTRDKDPLEFTGTDGQKIQVEKQASRAAALREARQSSIVPVQDFQDFKYQVQNLVNSGN